MNNGSGIDVSLGLVCNWFDKSLVNWFAFGLHPNIHWGLAVICMWFGMPNNVETKYIIGRTIWKQKLTFFRKCLLLLLGIEPVSERYLQRILPLYHVSAVFKYNTVVYIYFSAYLHIKIR